MYYFILFLHMCICICHISKYIIRTTLLKPIQKKGTISFLTSYSSALIMHNT